MKQLQRLTRDGVLFLLGVVMLANEAFVEQAARGEIITAGVAIVLSPVVLRADERRRNGDSK